MGQARQINWRRYAYFAAAVFTIIILEWLAVVLSSRAPLPSVGAG
jgi:hypothetical protein